MTSCRSLLARMVVAALLASPACAQKARPNAPARSRPSVASVQTPLLGEDPGTTLLAVEPGIAGDRVSALLELPNELCGLVIARAGSSIQDLDLVAYGDDGSLIGSDERPDKTPALLICPPHPKRIWLSARIAAGSGLVALGAQRLAVSDAPGAAARFKVSDPSAEDALSPQAVIDEHLQAHRRQIGGDWQTERRASLPLDSKVPSRFSAAVEAGGCLEAMVLPSAETAQLELTAYDVQGAVLGRAAQGGRDRFLVLCSPAETNVAFEVRPQSGRGSGLLLLSRSRRGTEHAIEAESVRIDTYATREAEAELREVEGRNAALGVSSPGRRLNGGVTLEVGRRQSIPLRLTSGCSRFEIVAGAPLRGIEAWIYSNSGALLSHDRDGKRATLFVCSRGGNARLDLEASQRPGPALTLQYHDADVPAPLLDSELAAARLLSDVVRRGVLRRPSEIGQVTEVSLSPSQLHTLDLTVPFGRCVDVAMALDGDGAGAEIRLVSVKTGAELARGRGTHGANAHVCAGSQSSLEESAKTRAELRIEIGSSKALVATRLLNASR